MAHTTHTYTHNNSNQNQTMPAYGEPFKIRVKKVKKAVSLCKNTDCMKNPPLDSGEQWVKCSLCDGYFNDDGLGDILFIEEAPNNKTAECGMCGKTSNIIQMKGTGEYVCANACDEDDEDDEDD